MTHINFTLDGQDGPTRSENPELTPESSLSAFLEAFNQATNEKFATSPNSETEPKAGQRDEPSQLESAITLTSEKPADPSTTAFFHAFESVLGVSPLAVASNTPTTQSSNRYTASSQSPPPASSTSPPPLQSSIPPVLNAPTNASFLLALEEVAGGNPWAMPGAFADDGDPTITPKPESKLPPPDQMASTLLAHLHETLQVDASES